MSERYPLHTVESAPADSKGVLMAMRNKFGFDLNMFGMLATSSKALKAYIGINEIFARSSFSPLEQQIVMLAASHQNACHYCVAAHTTGSLAQDLPADVIKAAASGQPIEEARLEALRQFTTDMVERRGEVDDGQVEAFLGAGFTPENVLEVVLGIALKTISNYANHIMETPLDDAFKANVPDL